MSEKEKPKPSELEFARMLSEVRNGLQTCVESIDAYLNLLSKAELGEWNPEKFNWIEQEGTKGKYQKAHFDDSTDFKAMIEDLKKHNGKVTRAGLFYWLFTDEKTVGRKRITN